MQLCLMDINPCVQCFVLMQKSEMMLRKPETIESNKEFCDCKFEWNFTDHDAHGISVDRTIPAYPTEIKTVYPKQKFKVENAACIPCEQVLGTYKVLFDRVITSSF